MAAKLWRVYLQIIHKTYTEMSYAIYLSGMSLWGISHGQGYDLVTGQIHHHPVCTRQKKNPYDIIHEEEDEFE